MTPAEKLSQEKKNAEVPAVMSRRVKWICTARSKRKALGITLRDVEEATGINNATLSQVENGFNVTLTIARKIADFYGCSERELWPERINVDSKDEPE